MTLRRGSTLIEMMIVVAILSIVSIAGINSAGRLRQHSTLALQRERALQVLEYEAAAISTGRPADAGATSALLATLPGARLESRSSNGMRRLAVLWTTPGGETSRELFLVETRR